MMGLKPMQEVGWIEMPIIEDRTRKKRWIVRQADLKVYNKVRLIVGTFFTLIFLPIVIFSLIGSGCDLLQRKLSDSIIHFTAVWITAIILRKHKEYPQVVSLK
jgi:hypothetical protein